ncbi:hypothetical protein WG66_005340 [Moniliophthora roreri]|nr:hypothetical protein WG66_005340 [Moniliophthora roreri]
MIGICRGCSGIGHRIVRLTLPEVPNYPRTAAGHSYSVNVLCTKYLM